MLKYWVQIYESFFSLKFHDFKNHSLICKDELLISLSFVSLLNLKFENLTKANLSWTYQHNKRNGKLLIFLELKWSRLPHFLLETWLSFFSLKKTLERERVQWKSRALLLFSLFLVFWIVWKRRRWTTVIKSFARIKAENILRVEIHWLEKFKQIE